MITVKQLYDLNFDFHNSQNVYDVQIGFETFQLTSLQLLEYFPNRRVITFLPEHLCLGKAITKCYKVTVNSYLLSDDRFNEWIVSKNNDIIFKDFYDFIFGTECQYMPVIKVVNNIIFV